MVLNYKDQMKNLLNSSKIPWCEFDSGSGRILDINAAYFECLGADLRSQETLVWEQVLQADRAIFAENIRIVQEYSIPRRFIVRMLHAAGRGLTAEWTLHNGLNDANLLATFLDITVQQRATLLLQQSEEVSGVGSWEIDLSSKELYWSQRTHQIHETDPLSYKPKLEDGLSFYHPESVPMLTNAVDELMNKGTSYDLVLKFITAKGRMLWVRAIARALFSNDRIARVYGTFEDVTNEQEEKIAVASFREIAETSQEGIWEVAKDGTTLFANKQIAKLLRASQETLRTQNIYRFLAAEDARRLRLFLFDEQNSSETAAEFSLTSSINTRLWVRMTRCQRFDSKGRVDSVLVMISDLTSLKDRESSLRLMNDRMEYLLEGARLGAWDWWLADNTVYFDKRWCEMLGLDFHEVKQELATWEQRVHPDDKAGAYEDIKAHIEGHTPFYENVHRMRHANGEWVWILDQGRISERDREGKPVRFTGTHLNITAQKTLESTLMAKAAQEERFFSLSQEILCVAGFDGYFKHVNPAFCRLTGLTERQMLSTPFLELIHPDDAMNSSLELGRLAQSLQTFQFVNRYRTCAGDYKTISWNATPDTANRLIYAAGRDVTASLKTEAELKQTLSAVNQSLMVVVTDVKGNILQVNKKFSDVSGYPEAELVHKNHNIVSSGFHSKEFYKAMFETIAAGKIWSGEFKNRRKDASIYYVQSVIAPLFDSTNQIERYMSFSVDLSEMKATEHKLMQASKMATLGEMAGGVAHEINNPLAIIQGKATQMMRRLVAGTGDQARLIADLEIIDRTTVRIAKIVKGLRTFSRNSEKDPMRVLALREIVDEAIDLCAERLKSRSVTLQVSVPEHIHIECRPDQISQVLLNLVGNSVHAVSDTADPWISLEAAEENELVILSVTDSGPGIPEEIAEKMMQPFFTTKEVGKGTGLGLSISKGIVEEHNGQLRYDPSSPNTRFVLELPKAKNSTAAA